MEPTWYTRKGNEKPQKETGFDILMSGLGLDEKAYGLLGCDIPYNPS